MFLNMCNKPQSGAKSWSQPRSAGAENLKNSLSGVQLKLTSSWIFLHSQMTHFSTWSKLLKWKVSLTVSFCTHSVAGSTLCRSLHPSARWWRWWAAAGDCWKSSCLLSFLKIMTRIWSVYRERLCFNKEVFMVCHEFCGNYRTQPKSFWEASVLHISNFLKEKKHVLSFLIAKHMVTPWPPLLHTYSWTSTINITAYIHETAQLMMVKVANTGKDTYMHILWMHPSLVSLIFSHMYPVFMVAAKIEHVQT